MLTMILDMLGLAWLMAQPVPPAPKRVPAPPSRIAQPQVAPQRADQAVVEAILLTPYGRPTTPIITRGAGNSITISGRLFYNDRRDVGLHGVRRDQAGKPTTECDPEGVRIQRGPDGTCSLNWAGAHMVAVEAIERDAVEPPAKPLPAPPNWAGCKREDIVGSATINERGEYRLTISGRDACALEAGNPLSIQLRFQLRFCDNTLCFSVRRPNSNDDPAGDPYRVSHRDASAQKPLMLTSGDRVEMPDGFFKTSSDGAVPDFEAVAANTYASLVDTILTIHRTHGIPFFKAEFGELEYVFPADDIRTTERGIRTGSATTISERLVVQRSIRFEDDPDTERLDPVWVSGFTPAHEYGHVMMLRAWGGDYGYDGYGVHDDRGKGAIEGRAEDPAPQIAFKEGWADFVGFIAFESAGNNGYCQTKDIEPVDDPNDESDDDAKLYGTDQTGVQFLTNNLKAICDWYDQTNDGDDLFEQHDFPAMWRTLRGLHTNRSRIPQAYPGLGRTICDFVIHYQYIGPQSGRLSNPSSGSRYRLETGPLRQNRINCPLVQL